MQIRDDLSSIEWDYLIAVHGGHPLQSALWGNAKKKVYGIGDHRIAVFHDNTCVALVRVEIKRIKRFVKLAWIPQGPVLKQKELMSKVMPLVENYLKRKKFDNCAVSPWHCSETRSDIATRKTIWIDLTIGKEQLWKSLNKQWRYGVRHAQRLGVFAITTNAREELSSFYKLCQKISQQKQFNFPYSDIFMCFFLENGQMDMVDAKLFVAKYHDEVAAGALIIKSGKHIHYMWGAVDRQYSKYRPGELVQWEVLSWAVDQGCELYDLEGIDTQGSSSVAAFKKKMGGQVIHLSQPSVINLNWKGYVPSILLKKKLQCH